MTNRFTTIEKQGPMAVVRFDRKENLNAFSQALVLELTDVARSFHDDVETQAIVLTGAAEAFSAGADLKDTYFFSISFGISCTDLELLEHLCEAFTANVEVPGEIAEKFLKEHVEEGFESGKIKDKPYAVKGKRKS